MRDFAPDLRILGCLKGANRFKSGLIYKKAKRVSKRLGFGSGQDARSRNDGAYL